MVGLSLLPPTVVLIVQRANGALSYFWLATALGLGFVAGGLAALAAAYGLSAHTKTLESTAEALLQGRRPQSALDRHPLAPAERKLQVAFERLLDQIDSLSLERDELETVLRSMTEAVVVTDSDGFVVILNGAACELFGLSSDADYRGRNFIELCRDPKVAAFLSSSIAAENPGLLTTELDIQSPMPRSLRLSVAPVRGSHHGSAARVLVFHDVSRLKAYENLRSDFVANVSHELKTPLTALCGYAETLLKGVKDPATQRRFLEIIERQATRLSRLIDDLLLLSDLERGLTPLRFELLDPRRLLEETMELMRQPAERQGLTLNVESNGEVPALEADRDRLQQVLLNLVSNAIKYTPSGGRVVGTARALNHSDPALGAGVEFAVIDTGEGIPAAHIPRLTERFYRVDRARSRELGGTGLGLAIVKHIVQLHHGRLTIESRLREGTTVRVWLPAGQLVPPNG